MAGDDLLAGGKGDDRLNGGSGKNFLTGGEGKDTVFYEPTGENGVRLNAAGITDTTNAGGPKIPQLTTAFGGPLCTMRTTTRGSCCARRNWRALPS